MDPEDFSNYSIDEDYTDDDEESIYDSRLFIELVTLVGVLSIVANLLIVFVILKFKKLRKDVTNMLVVHLNIFEAAYSFFTPVTLRMSTLIDTTRVNMTVICVASDMEYVVNFATSILISLLVYDSYIKLYHEDIYTKFCRVYKFIVICVYVSTICLCVVAAQLSCQSEMYFDTFLVIIAANVIFLLFVIVMNIIHAVKKRRLRLSNKNNVGLVITNLYCFLSCPNLLVNILYIFGIRSIIMIAITVTGALAFSDPIFSLFYLFHYDNQFNIYLKKVLGCKCKDYENDELQNLSVTYNDVNGAQIT